MAVFHQVTSAHISTLSLADLGVFLRDTEVISSSYKVIAELIRGNNTWNKIESTPFVFNIRFFLAAYMIVYQTNNVLENIDDQVMILIESSKNLVRQFNRVTNVLMLPNDDPASMAFKERRVKELADDFYNALVDYFPKFHAWKNVRDCHLAQRIVNAVWELHEAKVDIAGDNERDDLTDPYVIQCNDQIERLRVKLVQNCGFEALYDLDTHIARELENRRFYLLLRQEHARHGGEGGVFDFFN